MTIELSKDEFQRTIIGKMVDVTEEISANGLVWSYAIDLAMNGKIPAETVEHGAVTLAFRDERNLFEHLLLPAWAEDSYVILVIDLREKCIKGHFEMDMIKDLNLTC